MSDKTAKLFMSYRILERIQEFLVVELSREGKSPEILLKLLSGIYYS